MDEEIITKSNQNVQMFFHQARVAGDMLGMIGSNVRPPLDGKSFIDDKELSKRLSLSRRTLLSHRNDNVIPYYKIGGKVIYEEEEVLQWLDQNFHPRY